MARGAASWKVNSVLLLPPAACRETPLPGDGAGGHISVTPEPALFVSPPGFSHVFFSRVLLFFFFVPFC